MKIEKYDLSIITPFYNGNSYMEKLFACIRNCAARAEQLKIEWIIVNDSPWCEVVYKSEWIEGFNLHVYNNEKNVGIQQSRINGIVRSEGKYILMLDQDDLLLENALESQMGYIKDADIVVSNGIDENPNNAGKIYKSENHQKFVKNEHFYFSIGNMIVSPGQCVIKKSAIPELWMNNIVKNNGSDDLLLWLLMFRNNCKWVVNPESTYVHVYTGSNVSADLEKMEQSTLEVISIMDEYSMIEEESKSLLKNRYKMRKIYEGKGMIYKIIAFVRYPNIAIDLMKLKCK